MMQGQQNVKSQ